jgi:hypothetical protein
MRCALSGDSVRERYGPKTLLDVRILPSERPSDLLPQISLRADQRRRPALRTAPKLT